MEKHSSNINLFLKSRDAVSEVMDYVIILGIIILSLSAIGLGGYPILKNAQKNSNIENAKHGFIALANELNKVALGQAPSRSMELNIQEGRLSVTGNSTINISAINSTGDLVTLVDGQMRSIEYSVGDAVIAYEGTGVWIRYPSGGTLNLYRPVLSYQDNVLVIPVVKINGASSIAGTGTSRITANGMPGISVFSNVSNLTLTISSDYLAGWMAYYRDALPWDYCSANECFLNRSDVDAYILNTQLDTVIE